jgi:uncharacterized protein (TIGR00369 family)
MNQPDLAESPYHRFLDLKLTRYEDGLVEIVMPFREELLREDGSDWLHGGIIASLIDIAGDCAVYSRTGGDVPTVDLRIDYLRPAKRGSLSAIGRIVKVGRRVGVADVEVRDEQGQVVAVGRGVYASPAQQRLAGPQKSGMTTADNHGIND